MEIRNPNTHGQVINECSSHAVEYYVAVKKEEVLVDATTRVSLLSEGSRMHKSV